MIQDIAPHRLDNHFDPERRPEPEDRIISWNAGRMLIAEGKELRFPRVAEAPEIPLQLLFLLDGTGYFLTDRELELPGYGYCGARELRRQERAPQESMFAAFTAMHLAEWYRVTRFCGACGEALRPDPAERAMACPRCGEKVYPRINPAVIVGVTNGERLLLTRYRAGGTMNALVAGFTEIGETLEETVQREVMEETGLRVRNIRYYKSQPWGIALDLLAGFFCEVDGDDTIRMDRTELKYAEWVPRRDIELQPTNYSLTNEMMRLFRDGRV